MYHNPALFVRLIKDHAEGRAGGVDDIFTLRPLVNMRNQDHSAVTFLAQIGYSLQGRPQGVYTGNVNVFTEKAVPGVQHHKRRLVMQHSGLKFLIAFGNAHPL
jgi:hypothetical protein